MLFSLPARSDEALPPQQPADHTEQSVSDVELLYPEGAAVPRALTESERRYLRDHDLGGFRGESPPPTGPVHCAAEYEPMEGLLIAWEGPTEWLAILARMGKYVTTDGDADLYVVLDSTSEKSSASSRLSSAGVDMDRVRWVVRTTDTIWIRDYGPRYIYEGDCRAIIDHTYNRPRPNDDKFPEYFAQARGHARYEIPLIHGGGNFHLDALDSSYVTRLIVSENEDKTEQEIHDLWQAYQNVDTTFFDPFPQDVDYTQHIDMWMQVIADDTVVISDWPYQQGSTQDKICDGAAESMQDQGYRVFRTPARTYGGTHYTYTNVVMCNGIVLIPSYSNSTIRPLNDDALEAWQDALPDKSIIPIDSENIVAYAGVLHCIVMHLPEPRGGPDPTVYLKNLRGGQTLAPGDTVAITWISDDDVQATSMDVLLSLDGGERYNAVLASGHDVKTPLAWTVPDVGVSTARIRLVVHDDDGNSGADQSDADFTITGRPLTPGDLNCDGDVSFADIDAFVLVLTDPAGYESQYPGCYVHNADCNLDLSVDFNDIDSFVELLIGG
jgi:agmatine/peptidylarginine deiminase